MIKQDIISKKTRLELREYFVGTILREIKMEFDAVDIDCDYDYEPPEDGQRRSLVEQYYHTLDFNDPIDVRKFINLYGNVLSTLEDRTKNDLYPKDTKKINRIIFNGLKKWIEKDGFIYEDGNIKENTKNILIDETVKTLEKIDGDYVNKQLERINESIEKEPDLAIGTAKELIETVCKTILDERNVDYGKSEKIGELVKKVRKVIKLLPDDIDNKVKGEGVIKVLLSNLGNIAQNMAELRGLYGTGHGKSAKTKSGLTQRHARLAAGAASTLAIFLYETHLEREK